MLIRYPLVSLFQSDNKSVKYMCPMNQMTVKYSLSVGFCGFTSTKTMSQNRDDCLSKTNGNLMTSTIDLKNDDRDEL